MRFGLKKLLLFFALLFLPISLFSQNDFGITNVQIVGGSSLCPNDQVSFQVTIRNNNSGGGNISVVDPQKIYYYTSVVSGSSAVTTGPFLLGIDPGIGTPNLGPGVSETYTFPQDFVGAINPANYLDFSANNSIYTLTVSFTHSTDTVTTTNNVSTTLNIRTFDIPSPILQSDKAGEIICQGEDITFTVTPFQVGAQYSFKVNSGLISTTTAVNPGDNSFTFSQANGNALANNDIVTIDMIDSNGCTVNTSTQSLTVTVNNPPSVTLTSSAPEEYYCEAGTVTFTASSPDVVTLYEWFVDGAPYVNNNPTFSLAPTGTQTVTVRITSASGCTATNSLTLEELSVIDDGNIELSNPLDINVCSGNTPLGSIVGDGTGTSSQSAVSNGSPGYQWQLSYTGAPGSFIDIDGANSVNYTPNTISRTTYYRRNTIVSPGPASCSVVGTDIVVINARPDFNINLSITESSTSVNELVAVQPDALVILTVTV